MLIKAKNKKKSVGHKLVNNFPRLLIEIVEFELFSTWCLTGIFMERNHKHFDPLLGRIQDF